jgi:DNA-binding CsgD family transcriptional regulator
LNELAKIINQRTVPGTLIFDFNNRLLFLNKEAMALLHHPNKPRKNPIRGRSGIPKEIFFLCDQVKGKKSELESYKGGNGTSVILRNETGLSWAARAFLLDRQGEEKEASHIMILLERVVEKHTVNVEEVAGRFNLSLREVEVVSLVCEGCTNREIGGKLYISEHTVKDHIKNIMRKMQVATRNGIVAVLI